MDSIILTDKNIQQNVKCHFWKYSNHSSSHILFWNKDWGLCRIQKLLEKLKKKKHNKAEIAYIN